MSAKATPVAFPRSMGRELLGVRVAGAAVLVVLNLLASPAAGDESVDVTARKAEVRAAAEGSAVREATSQVIVQLGQEVDVRAFAAGHGLVAVRPFLSDASTWIFEAGSVAAAEAVADRLADAGHAGFVAVNRRAGRARMAGAFIPDDPYFPNATPSAAWPGQWHLENQVTPGLDANVRGAWNAGWTGAGVVIGIVDDGLQINHPDLSANVAGGFSYDFGGNDADPSPVYIDDSHGTSVAGVAGARGGNGIGVTGAAPRATLAGLRVDFPNQTDAMFADASLYLSGGGPGAIAIKNHSYGVGLPYIRDAGGDLQAAAVSRSTALGTIHVFSAGNERDGFSADANSKQDQSNPDVITVAALGSDGTWATYSSFGANVFVTAPSSSGRGLAITTTDRTGSAGYNPAEDFFPDRDYTSQFGGTSSSAPLVAGVLALVKEAQPALDTRFAKHLLARTSTLVDPGDATVIGGGDGFTPGSAWKTNAAGLAFNMNYGFGLVNAGDLVNAAVSHAGVSVPETYSSGALAVNAPLPDLASLTRTTTVQLSNPRPLEEVVVTLDVPHTYAGDLTATLTSPAGTSSRLMTRDFGATGDLTWSFTSNAFWGETDVNGTWTLQLSDVLAADSGTWRSWRLDLRMGELTSAPAGPATLAWAGGSGLWSVGGGTRWEGGEWLTGRRAVFGGSSGTVTIAPGGVRTTQPLEFASAGYTLVGGALTLGGTATAANAIVVAGGTTTVLAPLSGTTGLAKEGDGTLVLAGGNTLSGGAVVTAGTLQIGNGGTGGGIGGPIDNHATVVFQRAGTVTQSHPIAGSGSVVQRGGTLVLTGANTHAGGTVVESGTLQIGGGGISGSLQGPIVNAGAVVFDRIDTVTFAGSVSGTGTMLQRGAGTLVLSGEHTSSGTFTVQSGTLRIGAGGTSGSVAGPLVNLATIVFDRDDTASYAGTLTGTGTLVKAGAGRLDLNGANEGFTGTVRIDQGSLRAAEATLGGGEVLLTGGGLVAAGGGTIGNAISIGGVADPEVVIAPFSAVWRFGTVAPGSAAPTVTGAEVTVGSLERGNNNGSTTLLTNSAASSGYTLPGGISASGGYNAGAAARTGNLSTAEGGSAFFGVSLAPTSGGSLVIDTVEFGTRSTATGPRSLSLRSSSDDFVTDLAGAAVSADSVWAARGLAPALTSAGPVELRIYGHAGTGSPSAGTANWRIDDLVISGSATTLVPGGRFPVEAELGVADVGGIGSFSGSVLIDGTARLTAAASATAVFTGSLGGVGGDVVASGPGTIVLAGVNTYGGITTVAGGTLRVDGSTPAGALGVAAGAVLAGSGTIGGSALVAGRHAPGASAGTQTFASDLAYASGAVFAWELYANTALDTSAFDRVVVRGDLAFADASSIELAFDGAGSMVDWTDSFWSSEATWPLFSVAGTTSGLDGLSLATGSWFDGFGRSFASTLGGGSFALAARGQDVLLAFTPVPEPSAFGQALAAVLLALTVGRAARRSPAASHASV